MYLGIQEAARRLGVSRQWLHELIKRGEIGTTEYTGRRVVIDDERFKALRREREAKQKDVQ